MVRLLLEAGVSIVSTGGPRSSTPLHLAARFGHTQTADALVRTPVDLEQRLVRHPRPRAARLPDVCCRTVATMWQRCM